MKRVSQLFLLVALMGLVSSQAQAQMAQWTDRVFVNINYATQSGSATDLASASSWTLYDETAKSSSTVPVDGKGSSIDLGGGVRVWGNFGVGASYFTFNTKGVGTVTASVPHPLFYDRPRTATASVEGLEHKQKALNLMGVFVLPISDKFDVAISAGPSFFSLEQATLSAPTIGPDVSPYTTITMASVTKVTTVKNKTGFNAGADATFRLTKYLGLGGFVRYAKTSVEYTPEGGADLVKLDVGGVAFGGGLRIRF